MTDESVNAAPKPIIVWPVQFISIFADASMFFAAPALKVEYVCFHRSPRNDVVTVRISV